MVDVTGPPWPGFGAGGRELLAILNASVGERDHVYTCISKMWTERRPCRGRPLASGHAGPPGVPLRACPHRCPASGADQPRRRRTLGLELGPGRPPQGLAAPPPDPERHGPAPAAQPAQAHRPLRLAV